ncbi:putative membrane protein [Methanohalophilus levihalophilus]|nr:putative membrane protein [Methanohalophilus levihalophilus]
MFLDLMGLVGIGLSLLLEMHLYGDLHLYLGLLLVFLILAHMYLHWKSILKIYEALMPDHKQRRLFSVLYVLACLLLFFGVILHHIIFLN